MPGLTLAATALVHALVATSAVVVAVAILRRRVPGTHGATAAIVAWWLGLAAYLYLQAALHLATLWAPPSLDAFLWSRLVAIPLLCAAPAGLTYYILYLVTGKPGWRLPVAALYLATTVLFFVQTFLPPPTQLHVTPWLIELDIPRRGLTLLVYALVGLPPILGSLALLAVAHRMEPPQRFRAVLVGSAILAYVGSGLAAFVAPGDLTRVAALNGMGLVAAILMLTAYYPPGFLRRRFGIADAKEMERRAAHLRRRREEFVQRGNELV